MMHLQPLFINELSCPNKQVKPLFVGRNITDSTGKVHRIVRKSLPMYVCWTRSQAAGREHRGVCEDSWFNSRFNLKRTRRGIALRPAGTRLWRATTENPALTLGNGKCLRLLTI